MKRPAPDDGPQTVSEIDVESVESERPTPSSSCADDDVSAIARQEGVLVKQNSSSPAVAYANIPGFLTKTFEIFTNAGFSKLCSWGAAGDTIVIYKIPEFAAEVLPQYFKHSNFQSFVRQLNMYDFHKTVQDPSHGEFQHQYFRKGRPDLLHLIKRKVGSASGSSSAGSTAVNSSGGGGKVTRTSQSQQGASCSSNNNSSSSNSNGASSSSTAMTAPSPLARAMAEAWPEHKEKIAAHTDTVITELVQLQHWAKHMEHRIVELEAQNRHLNTANDTLWKTLQKHSASQLQMQTKMQKIIYFLYHTVLTPEAKAQLEQLDADSGNMLMFKNQGQLGNGMGPAGHMRQNPQIGGQNHPQQHHQQQQQHGGAVSNMQGNLFAESLKYLNLEMPGVAPTPMPNMMPAQGYSGGIPNMNGSHHHSNNGNSGSSNANNNSGSTASASQAAMSQLMQHLNQLSGGVPQGPPHAGGNAGVPGMILPGMPPGPGGPLASLYPPPQMGAAAAPYPQLHGIHPGLAATLTQQIMGASGPPGAHGLAGQNRSGPVGYPNMGGSPVGMGAAAAASHQMRQPYMSAQVLNATNSAAAAAAQGSIGDMNMARAGLSGGMMQQSLHSGPTVTGAVSGSSKNAMDRHPAKRQRRGGSSDSGTAGTDRGDSKDTDTAAFVREDMEDLGMAEAETYNKLDSLESHLSSLFEGDDFEAMLNVG